MYFDSPCSYKKKWIAPVGLHAISWSNADWEWPRMAANYFYSNEFQFIMFIYIWYSEYKDKLILI